MNIILNVLFIYNTKIDVFFFSEWVPRMCLFFSFSTCNLASLFPVGFSVKFQPF